MIRGCPSSSFEIRFYGANISPEAIPLRILARALSAVQRLLSEDEESVDEEARDEVASKIELHLLGVKRGSATYPVLADRQDEVLARLRLAGEVLESPDRAGEVPAVLSPVEELSGIAKSLGCKIEFRLPGKGNDVLATITPLSYDSIASSVFVYGETSVSGKVERVGGATELRCGLRIRQQPDRMLICRVESADVARQLGQHLYEEVVVSGTATWYRRNWRLRSMSIRSMEQIKRRSLVDGIRALREAGGHAWDKVEDPRQLLQEVRGE